MNNTVDGFCDGPCGLVPGAVDRLPLAPRPVAAVPPGSMLRTDTDGDGVCDDVNGNGRIDSADMVRLFTLL